MVTIVILAGGESSRLGQNKALLPFLGEAMILRIIRQLWNKAEEVLIVSNPPESLAFLGFPVVADVIPGVGALGGLLTALSAARGERVAVLACDMPFANPHLLQAEMDLMDTEEADVVIPATPKGLEPLHALYRRNTCLPAVQRAVAGGEKRLVSWFADVKVRVVQPDEMSQVDPQGLAFFNINTPQDHQWAEKLALEMC